MERSEKSLALALSLVTSTVMAVALVAVGRHYSRTTLQAIHGVAAELQEREFDAAGQVAALGHDVAKLAARVEGNERVDKLLIGWIDQLAEERSRDMEVLQRSADAVVDHTVRLDALESVLPTPDLPPGLVTPLYRELGVPADAEAIDDAAGEREGAAR